VNDLRYVSRRVFLAGSISTGLAVLAACSSAAPTSPTASSASPASPAASSASATTVAPTPTSAPAQVGSTAPGAVKLEYWTFMPTNPRFQARPTLFAEFGNQNNCTVEITDVTSGNPANQKMAAAAAAHLEPDLADMGNVDWGKQGFIMPVNDVMNQLDSSDFSKVSVTFGTWQGKLYGIPFIGFPHVMHYRKDWFDQEGIKVPTTTDELIAAAKKLTGKTKDGQDRAGLSGYFASGHAPVEFQNFVGPNDGYTFDEQGKIVIDSDQVFQAMKAINQLIPTFEPGYTNEVYDNTRQMFIEGKIAIEIDSTSMGVTLVRKAAADPTIGDRVSSALIPWGPSSKHDRSGYSGVSWLNIGAQTKNADLARKSLLWFFSKETLLRAFAGPGAYDWGLIPPRISIATSLDYLSKVPTVALPVLQAGGQAVQYDTFPGQDWGPNPIGNTLLARDTYRSLLIKVGNAKSDDEIKAALQWAKQDIQQAMQQA
jgi:ABC-type glycerol-3-phosphate transport system substrate-binding protein